MSINRNLTPFRRARHYLKIWSLIGLILPIGCSFWGKLDNPLDPDAESYQGFPIVADVPAFSLVSPEDGSAFIFPAELVTTGVVDATVYGFQVSSSADFAGTFVVLVEQNTNVFYLETNDLQSGTYYWRCRVQGKDENWSDWTDPRGFSINSGVEKASIRPVNSALTIEGTTTFDWEDVLGAERYEIRFATDIASFDHVIATSVSKSEYQLATFDAIGSILYWQVRSFSDDGRGSVWSDIWSVRVLSTPVQIVQPTQNRQDSGYDDACLDLAIDIEGNLYAIGRWNQIDGMGGDLQLRKFDSAGNEYLSDWMLNLSVSEPNSAHLLIPFPFNNVFVAYESTGTGTIHFDKFNLNGENDAEWAVSLPASNSFPAIGGIDSDSTGNIFAIVYTDYDNVTVIKIPQSGGRYAIFYEAPLNNYAGSGGTGLWKLDIDNDDNIISSYFHHPTDWQNTLVKLDPFGVVLWTYTYSGELYLAEINTDENGAIYLASTDVSGSTNNWHIRKIDSNGVEDTGGWPVVVSSGQNDSVTGLHVISSEYIVVYGQYSEGVAQIRYFSSGGIGIGDVINVEAAPDLFYPTSSATDFYGNLAICGNLYDTFDFDWYIRVFDSEGTPLLPQ
jgi:hypothetical protein